MRRTCMVALTIAVGLGSACADETPASPRAKSRQVRRHQPKPAKVSTDRPPVVVGGSAAGTSGAVPPPKVEGSWSIDPSWTASSGPTAAAYGTRGLLDELKHTPGESSGYGGGASLNLHF